MKQTWGTSAFEIVAEFGADGAVSARRRCTLVDFGFAMFARVSGAALAFVSVHLIETTVRSDGIARIVETLVDINLALGTQESWSAETLETLNTVRASTAVLARTSRTSQSRSSTNSAVVDNQLAILSSPSSGALALVISFQILTRSSVEARISGAFFYLCAAIGAGPTRLTDALSFEETIDASAVCSARRRIAKVHFDFATFTGETGGAGAAEIVQKVRAISSEETRRIGAVVDVIGAQWSFPSRRADALETALFEW